MYDLEKGKQWDPNFEGQTLDTINPKMLTTLLITTASMLRALLSSSRPLVARLRAAYPNPLPPCRPSSFSHSYIFKRDEGSAVSQADV